MSTRGSIIFEHNFFLLRTPLLPYQPEIKLDSNSLKILYTNPVLQEAIFLASPVLHKEMLRWLDGKVTEVSKVEKLEITLAKYFLRMSSRCTPFGLFAGVSMGRWGNKTYLQLPELFRLKRHTRLDTDVLCALSLHLIKIPSIRKELLYYPNTTLYRVGGAWRYVEYRMNNKRKEHFLIKIPSTTYLDHLLAISKNGAHYSELIAALVMDNNITIEEASDYVDELVLSQVLSSELDPAITGKALSSRLLNSFVRYKSTRPIALQFQHIHKVIDKLDASPLGTGFALYKEIENRINSLNIPLESTNLFQVDLHKPSPAMTVNEGVIQELEKVIQLLARLTPTPKRSRLQKFKQAFTERYESQEVLLMEVMDTEMGLGYPVGIAFKEDSLLDSLPLETHQTNYPTYEWSSWQQFLLNKYIAAIQQNHTCIELQHQEVYP